LSAFIVGLLKKKRKGAVICKEKMSIPKKKKEAPLIEPAKPFLFARGTHCSETTKGVMRDIAKLKGDQAKSTTGKNDFHPMEDETGIEQLCRTKEAAFFAFVT